MKFVANAPDAAALMMSARSFGNYDLPSALADLIDNSIKAHARKIDLHCDFNDGNPIVRVVDNGRGMSSDELEAAMRPASSNPLTKRMPDDLGRFGWGLKSASFSQCTRLTVITNQAGKLAGAEWNLNEIDDWKMGVLSQTEIGELASSPIVEGTGTEVIWRDCDRLSEQGTIDEANFNSLIVHARNEIALIYHKYLFGEVPRRSLRINLNGQEIRGFDPFYSKHDATLPLEEETLDIGGARVVIRPYVLPHYSKLSSSEFERLAGEDGFIRNQGFYVYRNHRLIIHGTWFRLIKFGELSQLVRICVEIPNTLDDLWKITIDKSDAQLPAKLKTKLKQVVDRVRKKSSRVFRSKGGRLDRDNTTVWTRYARHGEVRYLINRSHPLIGALLEGAEAQEKKSVAAALEVIEQNFPVIAFGADVSSRFEDIHQTEADPETFKRQVEAALPQLLVEAKGDFGVLRELLKHTEPYSQHWPAVEEVLSESGWSHAKS